jgi:Fe(3+) dicitrate transport protein
VFSQLAYATDPQPIELKAVTVTGILPDRLEAVPGSFSVVDEKELEVRRPFSIKEALNTVPGVNIVANEDPLGLALNIGIRGMDPRRTSRTLLMEDGMPLHLAPYGDPSAHYSTPLERVGGIEVVKGSGQILYGPQTVGGMINFVTKPVPRNGLAGSVMATGGNNDFWGLHGNVGYGTERGGFMIDALQKKGDGIRDNHDFDVQEFTLKGEVDLTDRQTLIAKVSYYEEDSHVSETGLGTIDYANDKFQAPTGNNDRFEHERKSIQLQHIFKIDDGLKLSTNAYYIDSWRSSYRQTDTAGGWNDETGAATGVTGIDMDENSGCSMSSPNLCGGRHRPRSYQVWGVEPRLDFSHKLFGLDNDAVVGFRYHDEDIQRDQFRDNSPLTINDLPWTIANGTHRESLHHTVKAQSAYVQNTFHINDWSLTPGVRVEKYKTKQSILIADSDPIGPDGAPDGIGGLHGTKSQTEVLPGIGAAWNGIKNTTVFGGVHRGFAPPRPDRDLASDPITRKFVTDKTTPELSTNFELGLRSKYFKGTSFESTLFHTKFDDSVIKSVAGSYVNAGEAAMSGLEFAGRIDFGTIYNTSHNVYLVGSYTNLFTAKFKKDGLNPTDGVIAGNRLPYSPKHLASVSFGYQHPVGIDARVGADFVSSQEPDAYTNGSLFAPGKALLAGYAGTIPAYTLFNASINFKPVNSKATYFLSGHNLTDKEYIASRVDGMFAGRSRQVFGGIRYDF